MSVAHDTHRVDDAVDLVESNLLLKAKNQGATDRGLRGLTWTPWASS